MIAGYLHFPRKQMLFWSTFTPPSKFIRNDIPKDRREFLATLLQRGQLGQCYMGWADCRICGKMLGTCDMETFDMIYPEKAEHYILVHNVWTIECDELLRRASSFNL